MVANSDFSAFIEQQTAPPAAGQEVDWEQEREEWLQYLGQFYALVEEFMGEYVNQNKVRLRRGSKTLNEEFIGAYSVDTMTLDIGPNSVIFDPVGTNLIGAKGRVDMRGAKGTVKCSGAGRRYSHWLAVSHRRGCRSGTGTGAH